MNMKIIVTGGLSSGKSAFIETISQYDTVLAHHSQITTPSTTQAEMDFGVLQINDDLDVHFYGTVNRGQVAFTGKHLVEGVLGYIVTVDSADPDTYDEAQSLIATLALYAPSPFVVAANKQDDIHALSTKALREWLHIPDDIDVLPCIATNRTSVSKVVIQLLCNLPSDDTIRSILEKLNELSAP